MLKPVLLAYVFLSIASFALPSPSNPDLVDLQLTGLAPRTHRIYIRDAIQGRFVEVIPQEDLRKVQGLDRRKSLKEEEEEDQTEDVDIEARTHHQRAAASTTSGSSATSSSSSDTSTTSSSLDSSTASSSPDSSTASSSPDSSTASSSPDSSTTSSSADSTSSSSSFPSSTSPSSSDISTSAPTASTTPPSPPPAKSQSSVPIAGIAVSVALGVFIILGACILSFICYRRSRKRKEAIAASTNNRDSQHPTNNPTIAASGAIVPDEDLPNVSQQNSASGRSIEDMFERRASRPTSGPLGSKPLNYILLDHLQQQNPPDPEEEEEPPYDPSRTSSIYDDPPSSRSHSSSLYDPPSSSPQADRHGYERSRPGSAMLSPGLQSSPLRNQMVRATYYETPDDVGAGEDGRRFSFEAMARSGIAGAGSARDTKSGT